MKDFKILACCQNETELRITESLLIKIRKPTLNIDTIPYTIMNSYDEEEKRSLFSPAPNSSVDHITPRINRLNNNSNNDRNQPGKYVRGGGQRAFSPSPNGLRLTGARSKMDTICAGCGEHGHNVLKNGCDFVANFIHAQRFVEQNPDMVNKILAVYAKYQASRKNQFNDKRNIAERIRNTARQRQVGIGPNVRALIDIMGDTMEEIIFDNADEDVDSTIAWDEIDVTLEEDFHDASTSPPNTPR